ncbi:HXXXD-type acyl-transferase family protein [Actinidia rufa]|uniref:HXXXD-type acyl-transferase family protein n=1 Tax=Actinidia rufa TaxID=165716 RepID=A0A7J0DPP7_9ERIC|nr:HXXXD-type acyl-transferase family protein [Actinidia rufa]
MEVQKSRFEYFSDTNHESSPKDGSKLPDYSAGNLLWLAITVAPTTKGQGQIELRDLVREMRSEIRRFDSSYVSKMQGEDGSSVVSESFRKRDEIYFETQGHLQPVWVSSAAMDFKNAIVLMDTITGDGIEAWVTLDEQDMPVFECNQDLLTYASNN